MLLSEIIYILLLYGGGICLLAFICIYTYSKITKINPYPTSRFENEFTVEKKLIREPIFVSLSYEQRLMEELIHKEEEQRRSAEMENRESIIKSLPRYKIINQKNSFHYRNATYFY